MKLISVIRRAVRVALFLSSLSVVGLVAARARATPPATMEEANHAFGEGRYDEAARDFEDLVRTNGYSAPLLFDLGNAYLRGGNPVRATLAYERALVLMPRDAAIRKNLATARAASSVTSTDDPMSRVAHLLPMSTWGWVAAGGFWCTMGLLAGGTLARRHRTPLFSAAAGGMLALGAAGGALALCRADLARGLVMMEAPVLVSPFPTAQSDFALPPGSAIELGLIRNGYVFVHDSSGRSGWLERAQVEPVVVRPS